MQEEMQTQNVDFNEGEAAKDETEEEVDSRAPGIEREATIVLNKFLEKLPAAEATEILKSCKAENSFVAFLPFVTTHDARVVKMRKCNDSKKIIDIMGFPGALLMAYRMHGIAVMSPQDWWTTIVQCISRQILLEHLVLHESTDAAHKLHSVKLDIQVEDTSIVSWLKDVLCGIRSAADTEILELLQQNYSTSTETSYICNLNAIVCAFKQRFQKSKIQPCQHFMCGLYGVHMRGTLADWQKLRTDFDSVISHLRKSGENYGIQVPWVNGIRYILSSLEETFNFHGHQIEVVNFWSCMVSGDCHSCSSSDSKINGWLSFLFSCQVLRPSVDLSTIPIDFSVSSFIFKTANSDHSDSSDNGKTRFQLCSGIVSYSLTQDVAFNRWHVTPDHECTLFRLTD